MVGETVSNFYIIDLIDRIGCEKIYKVQCVCSSIGIITETGLSNKISCGCTSVVGPHRIGLTVNCYKFTKFVGDRNHRHFYEITCESCRSVSIVNCFYNRKKCPKCPKLYRANEKSVSLQIEADRIGIHKNALLQRIKRMPVEEAVSFARVNVGGKKGIYGKVWFQNIIDSIPNHLVRIGKPRKRAFVYDWIRKGADPSICLQAALDGVSVIKKELLNRSCIIAV